MASFITPLFKTINIAHGLKDLVFERQKTTVGDLVIDASLKEDIIITSNVTEHPVENGTAISDHIFKQPIKLQIEGYITDSPNIVLGVINLPLVKNSAQSLIDNFKNLLPFNTGDTPSQQAYSVIMQMWKERALITIVTQLEVFDNMVIENVNFTKDAQSVHRLVFSMQCKQVAFVDTATSTITPRNIINKNITAVNSKKLDVGIVEKPTSIAKSIVNYFK